MDGTDSWYRIPDSSIESGPSRAAELIVTCPNYTNLELISVSILILMNLVK